MNNKKVKDIFGFWKLKNAEFAGKYEFPIIHGSCSVPKGLTLFTDINKETSPNEKAMCFYQYDENFEAVFESEKKLLPKLEIFRKYQSVILPDYSVYRDMPLCQQVFQIYRGRAAGNYLMQNGIPVIPNVRWGDERTYEFAFDGIEKNSLVAVGVQGAYKNKDNAFYFEKGFVKMLDVLAPFAVLCYGKISEDLVSQCRERKTELFFYETKISKVRFLKKSIQKEFDF